MAGRIFCLIDLGCVDRCDDFDCRNDHRRHEFATNERARKAPLSRPSMFRKLNGNSCPRLVAHDQSASSAPANASFQPSIKLFALMSSDTSTSRSRARTADTFVAEAAASADAPAAALVNWRTKRLPPIPMFSRIWRRPSQRRRATYSIPRAR
jgi:hypothetical protein